MKRHIYHIDGSKVPGTRRQKHLPGWPLSTSASPELLPGCELPPHSASCCSARQTIHITSIPVHPDGFFSFLMRDCYFFIICNLFHCINLSDNSLHNYSHNALRLLILLPMPENNYEITACHSVRTPFWPRPEKKMALSLPTYWYVVFVQPNISVQLPDNLHSKPTKLEGDKENLAHERTGGHKRHKMLQYADVTHHSLQLQGEPPLSLGDLNQDIALMNRQLHV